MKRLFYRLFNRKKYERLLQREHFVKEARMAVHNPGPGANGASSFPVQAHDWNQRFWDSHYDWARHGEEWSDGWGGSEVQWLTTLYPRIHSFVPADDILEIAPGFGRWTKHLLGLARKSYRAVDFAEKCADACQKRFAGAHPDFKSVPNDGRSLAAVADRTYDFVFSFDSLVHATPEAVTDYVRQLLGGLLRENGVCFMHHSNLAFANGQGYVAWPEFESPPGGRDPRTSAALVRQAVFDNGGKVLRQEQITWGGVVAMDCLSVFCRAGSEFQPAPQPYTINTEFEREASYGRSIFGNYCFSRKHS